MNDTTPIICATCGQELPFSAEDRQVVPMFVDIIVERHEAVCNLRAVSA